MLDAASVSIVLDAYRPERAVFVELLRDLDAAALALPTECPAYDVRGVAAHVLGDDLSLLSRQRDAAPNGLLLMAETMPGADSRTLLDAFNDRWVTATRFLSPELLVELLELTGEWTAAYYERSTPKRQASQSASSAAGASRRRSGTPSAVSSSSAGSTTHRSAAPSRLGQFRTGGS